MKVLVIGGGGREHALVWKIAQSPIVNKIYCAPGNAGISRLATLVPIKATDIDALLRFAVEEKIDLTVVGPEDPLAMGIVDLFESRGLLIFGPSKKAAELEASKAFAKGLMSKYDVPTASYRIFESRLEAIDFLKGCTYPVVVKADGLAAGKGVIVCNELDEAFKAVNQMMLEGVFGEAGKRIIIEECLRGQEASYLVFTDGVSIIPMPASQDHKPVFDGDRGPNTGGMGAYSPTPVVSGEVEKTILERIIKPVVRAMAEQGRPYKGVLYAGLMVSDGFPRVLEFNSRFGDPETQPIVTRMRGDIVPVLLACIQGGLAKQRLDWDSRYSVCVVMASKGYPGTYEKGKIIIGLEQAEKLPDVFVFHAGTSMSADGRIVTSGGRVLGVTGLGVDIEKAIEVTYKAVGMISWEGLYYRKDIGRKAIGWICNHQ